MQPPKVILCCYTYFNRTFRKYIISEHVTKEVHVNSMGDKLQRDTGACWRRLIKNTVVFSRDQSPVPMVNIWTSCKLILTWRLTATAKFTNKHYNEVRVLYISLFVHTGKDVKAYKQHF